VGRGPSNTENDQRPEEPLEVKFAVYKTRNCWYHLDHCDIKTKKNVASVQKSAGRSLTYVKHEKRGEHGELR